MKDVIDRAIVKLTAIGIVSVDNLIGCTKEDIEKIEKKYNIKLPLSYRTFLAAMGRSAGNFLVGTDCLFPAMLTLREQAELLLQECKVNVVITKQDFIFIGHQGYQFLFFKTGEKDDPEVFLYEDGEDDFKCIANSFSEWFTGCVDDEISVAKILNQNSVIVEY